MDEAQCKRFREYWGDYSPMKREADLWRKQDKINLEKVKIDMSDLKISGTISVIKETQVITDKFSKREFVVETDEAYPQEVQLELHKDQCSMIDGYSVGDSITASFNVKGRKWTSPQGEDKYFITLQVWSIIKATI